MYPNHPYFAVAITRTCGSGGGSYIGKKLAKDFGIDLYDRKLLRLAAEDSGINETLFAAADENTRKTLVAFLVQQLPQHLSLIVEQVLVGSEVVALRGDQLSVVELFGNTEQDAVPGKLVSVGKQGFIDATVLRGKTEQLPVIHVDAIIISQHLTDTGSAAAAGSCKCNYKSFHSAPPENKK